MLLVFACRAIGDVPALGVSPPLNLGDGQLSVSLGSSRTLRSAFTATLVQSIDRRKYNGVRATTCRMAEFGMALGARNSAPFRTEPSGDRKCAESVTSSERSSVSEESARRPHRSERLADRCLAVGLCSHLVLDRVTQHPDYIVLRHKLISMGLRTGLGREITRLWLSIDLRSIERSPWGIW